MSDNTQFYADNETSEEMDVSQLDLSIAYEVKPNMISEEAWENQGIAFFCHDCEKLVSAEKSKKGVKFTCQECTGKNVAFGTKRSLENFFHLNTEGVAKG